MGHRNLIVCLCLALTTAVAADTRLIDLHYADADQLAGVLASRLPPGASLNVYRGQLLLTGDPAAIATMMQLIKLLDSTPRQLLISVRSPQTGGSTQVSRSISRSGARAGPTTHTTVTTTRQAHSTGGRSNGLMTLRALAGQDALLQLSQPIVLSRPGEHSVLVGSGAGLWVNARVSGDQVVVTLRTSSERVNGKLGLTGINTQVTGRLGQWLPVGGLSRQDSQSRQRWNEASASRQYESAAMAIKVEILKPRGPQ